MRKLLVIAVLLCLIWQVSKIPATHAQDVTVGLVCGGTVEGVDISYDMIHFPSNWNVLHGNVATVSNLTYVGNALFGTTGTLSTDSGAVPAMYSLAEYKFYYGNMAYPVSSFTFVWTYAGQQDENTPIARVELVRYGVVVDSWQTTAGLAFNPGVWFTTTATFTYTGKVDTIRIIAAHVSTGSHGDNAIAIAPDGLCMTVGSTLTPTIAPPTETPTNTTTPVPTPTPSATLTPSITLTPSATAGAGTPTDSPVPTLTVTNASGTISGDFGGGPSIFNTLPPPDAGGCGDSFNPCGALPFQPPAWATISLDTVTAIASVTDAVGGTPTFTGFSGTAIAFATDLGGSSAIIGAGTITVDDLYGTPISIQDAANQIGARVGITFATARAIANVFPYLGKTGTILFFLFLIILLVIATRLFVGAYRVAMKILRLIIRFVHIINPISWITGGGQ